MSTSGTRTVLVTGGGGGIGRVTALLFAQRGYRVAVSDIQLDTAQQTVEQIRSSGGTADAYCTDVGDGHSVDELFGRLKADYGRLDAAFNNAGRGGGASPLDQTDDQLWDDCIRINLTGTYLCMKHELRMMLELGHGSIVNNSSINGLRGNVSAPYTASKHGVVGLTRSAAVAYAAKNIRVNAVCPGLIAAGLGNVLMRRPDDQVAQMIARHPVGRAGTAEEVAYAVIWLASDEASFVTGQALAIDGGLSSG